jgi:hypothetical protein
MVDFLTCPKCGSTDIKRNGKYGKGSHKGEQAVKCKKCSYKSFVTNFGGIDLPIAPISPEQREVERERHAKHRLGATASDATRKKMSILHTGQPGFWTGKTLPQSTCDKMSESHMGKKPWNKNKKMPEGTGDKISAKLKNKPKPPRTKEHCENISKSKTGENNPMFDKKHTPEALEKIHISQLGNTKKLGYRFPEETRIRMSEENRGENSSQWKGGITPMRRMIRESFEYREWIKKVFGRDNFTCQECGARGTYLHAHHVKQFSQILEENNITTLEEARNCKELWDINNGITFCKKCHRKKHFKE